MVINRQLLKTLDIASGKKMLDPEKAKEWFVNLEAVSQNIHQAF